MPPRAPSKGAPQKRGFWSKGLQYALIGAFLLAPLLALLPIRSRLTPRPPPLRLAPSLSLLTPSSASDSARCTSARFTSAMARFSGAHTGHSRSFSPRQRVWKLCMHMKCAAGKSSVCVHSEQRLF